MTVMEREQYHLGVQVAELDTAYTDYSGRLISAEYGLGETARDLEFLQDYASSIHYGLLKLEGSGDTISSAQTRTGICMQLNGQT